MSTSRTLFCDLCVILLFGVTVLAEEINTKPALQLAEFFKGNCSCGGFPNSEPEVGSEPLLSQSSGLAVNCAEEGQLTCKRMCNALAIATKAKGPEILCNKLKDVNELKLSAFYKVCDKPWIYADITAEEPICCESGVVKICASAEKTNATDIINVKTVM
ncbi:follicle cell protein 3C-1-like [Achroia grisella]|uniref:follicle cell protein 3C-1-like n=1 Tax=Achroia grisella TaxID=688607 RepID=UPI0027D29108|nr:follicle cell protein 3C-1-like [Achroia grisella]